ncbi:MAG TPA: hypothetical protein VFY35_02665, partial [Burkholderiaceae bacterium]|nr:hypothetical protein [Burkholderiaceae bacterium]
PATGNRQPAWGLFAALLSAGSDAWAQAACPGVCVGFSTGVQGVPFTPAGLALMAMALAIAAAVVLRKRQGGVWALVLAMLTAVGAAGFHAQDAMALPPALVINGATNPANLTLNGLSAAPTYTPVNVQNQLGTPITITNITVAPGLVLSPSSPLTSGSVIQPGATVNGGILVACDLNTDPGGCSAG